MKLGGILSGASQPFPGFPPSTFLVRVHGVPRPLQLVGKKTRSSWSPQVPGWGPLLKRHLGRTRESTQHRAIPGSRCWDSGGGVLWWPSEVLSPLRVFETQGGHPAKFWGELLIRRQLCQTAKCQKDFYSSFLLFMYLFSLSWLQILGWQEVESFSL